MALEKLDRMKVDPYLISYREINLKWIKDSHSKTKKTTTHTHTRPETVLSRKKLGKKLLDIGLVNGFL